jgi:hypothetical protein
MSVKRRDLVKYSIEKRQKLMLKNRNKVVVILFSLLSLISCNNKNDKEIVYVPFNLDSISFVSNAIYSDSELSVEIFINNQSKKDTFWIPISQWEMDTIFDKQGGLSKGMPLNNYIVNYFILHPKDSGMFTMYEKASGPIYTNFPKLWQIEPNSKKNIKIKFNLVEHFEKNINYEINTSIPLTSSMNLKNLLMQIPFAKDSSMFYISDSLRLSFNSISGVDRPWLSYCSSNIRLDSIYNKKLLKIINKQSLNNSISFRNELPEFFFDRDDYKKGFVNEINNANKKIVEESLRDLYSYKIIRAFQQQIILNCLIKIN